MPGYGTLILEVGTCCLFVHIEAIITSMHGQSLRYGDLWASFGDRWHDTSSVGTYVHSYFSIIMASMRVRFKHSKGMHHADPQILHAYSYSQFIALHGFVTCMQGLSVGTGRFQ